MALKCDDHGEGSQIAFELYSALEDAGLNGDPYDDMKKWLEENEKAYILLPIEELISGYSHNLFSFLF